MGTNGIPSGEYAAEGEEATVVIELLKAADDAMETGHLEALADGQCRTWLLDALSGASVTEPLVRATGVDRPQAAASALSLPLVAQDRDRQVVGAMLAVPSGTVISMIAQPPGYGAARAAVDAQVREDQSTCGA